MSRWYFLYACVVYVLLCLIPYGLGQQQMNNNGRLKCYICDTTLHADCKDPFEPENPSMYLQDCPNDRNYTICRKIWQQVEGDERVFRNCGWEVHDKPCYKTVSEKYKTTVCQCMDSECNSANYLPVFPVLIAIVAVVNRFM